MFLKIRHQVSQFSTAQITILTVWALIMVSLPIVDRSMAGSAMLDAITVGAVVTAGATLALLGEAWGVAVALRVSASIFVLSWIAEALGSRFGFPFGAYKYSDALQPQILGVPIQIPLGWLMMLPPAWAVGQAISKWRQHRWQFPLFVGVSTLAMAAWDLLLDPMMVAWGIWVWDQPSGYFGIPLINYLGWLLVSAVITIAIRPGRLPMAPLLMIYTAIWLLKSVGLGIFWGMLGPAIAGFILMGAITILAWRGLIQEK